MITPFLLEKTTLAHPHKLLDQVVAKIRFKHYSRRTELSYAHWVKRYILFHGKPLLGDSLSIKTVMF